MRSTLRELTPTLLREYGLRPWELDDLTYGEADALLEDLKAHAEARRRQANRSARK